MFVKKTRVYYEDKRYRMKRDAADAQCESEENHIKTSNTNRIEQTANKNYTDTPWSIGSRNP